MDKFKAPLVVFFLALTLLLIILGFNEITSLHSQANKETVYLRVDEVTYCSKDPTDSTFSKNPPYFVAEKYYWWIRITVYADANLTDVAVSDVLGEELMIEGVSLKPIDRPGPYDYSFEYDDYKPGAVIRVTDGESVWVSSLDENGVGFDCFLICWAEESLTPHFEWRIGSMSKGEVRQVYLTISTDTNPTGQQEFALPGIHSLDTNLTATGTVEYNGGQAIAETNGIKIEVLEKSG